MAIEAVTFVLVAAALLVATAMALAGLMGVCGVFGLARCGSCRHLVVETHACPYCRHEHALHLLHLDHPLFGRRHLPGGGT